MKTLTRLGIAFSVLFGISISANAQDFPDNDITLIWVTIKAYPGESLWQACRRVYQYDVYVVAGASGNKVRCKIEHSRIYQYGERRQNFNQ